MAIDQAKLSNVQNTLARFGVQAKALVELMEACGEVGSLVGAAREAEERRNRLHAEAYTIAAQLGKDKAEVEALAAARTGHEQAAAAAKSELAGLKAEHASLAPEVAEHRRLVAELPQLRQQHEELQAHIVAGRLRFAS